MDQRKKYKNPSPEVSANFLSRLLFLWIIPFFKYGYKNNLEIKDLYNCIEPDESEGLGDTLERHWNEEIQRARIKREQPELLTAIRKTFIKSFTLPGVVLLIQTVVFRTIQPIVLAEYLRYFNSTKTMTVQRGWLLGVSVVFVCFFVQIMFHYVGIETQRIGMRCRVACCSLVYRKLLRLNRTALNDTAAGHLVNLLSNDVARFDQAPMYMHYIWIIPIQAVVASYALYRIAGVAGFVGVGVILLQVIFVQIYLSKKQGDYRYKIAKATDYRVKLMNEITSGIQVIKMYAWEKPFEKIVAIARKKEVNLITLTSYIKGFSMAINIFTERVALFSTVVTYVMIRNELTSDVVFSVAQFMNSVQFLMAIAAPVGMFMYAEAKVSVQRIEQFLLKEENKTIELLCSQELEKGAIVIRKARASWKPSPIVDTLSDINLEIKPGSLVVVVGQVGSGKSSLLQLLVKELPLRDGVANLTGTISFASQEPWLFAASLKNNILFGQEYDVERYQDVVHACALKRDFKELPHGDNTLVSERGLSLSGGQRARVNLARAVYRKADIYIFDDPLSAVDAHVGKHMFEECILGYLAKKTRILTTHQLQFLMHADMIVIMKNGKIEKVGTYGELSEEELKQLQQDEEVEEKRQSVVKAERLLSVTSQASTVGTVGEDSEFEPQETQELIEKGTISTDVYIQYLKAGGILTVIFCIILLLASQVVTNASDLWLTQWTNVEARHHLERLNMTSNVQLNLSTFEDQNSTQLSPHVTVSNSTTIQDGEDVPTEDYTEYSRNSYKMTYTGLIIACVVLLSIRGIVFYKTCMTASKVLHNKMFNSILKATMRFFDTNPSGRILNRFSKDMGSLDELLPKALLDTVQSFTVIGGIIIMGLIVNAWMLIPTLFLGIVFYKIRTYYIHSAQDIKRLEGITKAPVFSHVTASLDGMSTIRSFGAQEMVIKEFDGLQNQHSSAWFLFILCSEAFGMYLDLVCMVYLTVVTLQFLVFDYGVTSGGNAGLVISQSLILAGLLQYGVRTSADFASQITSLERILQYTKLVEEGPFETLPANKPPLQWPQNGAIDFKNVYLRYVLEQEPVLKNLNITIKAGQKVGIAGRTGAGKSSLIGALFRLASYIEGEIIIDGVNTKNVGLSDLRRNISIIPQEPVLFSSTVRYNLDPLGNVEDDKILWKALEDVELKESIPTLDHLVSGGGSNFSAGQRQLMCLARAIIRNNKVLVMDEATANVDPQTDNLIQTTIRKNFKDCTVLTIAHRLNTIMDSDVILVMDAGKAVEFDHPHILLQNSEGYFAKMVAETGSAMQNKLKEIAKISYQGVVEDSEE